MGEETAISDRPPPATRVSALRATAAGALAALALGLAACGGDDQRQDADEPSGDYPVAVAASFPGEQRLAQAKDLRLEIENTGSDQIPNLAVTVYTDGERGGGSFTIRSDQPGLADPNRPVWIPEEGFPKLAVTGDEDPAELDAAPTAGATVAQTDTFAFGPVDAGESKDIVWRLTPVMAGAYTLNYEVSAGLSGNARAVAEDGGPVKGEFEVTISGRAPKATVAANGDVELQTK